uniref:Gnk2-homologous domain-containing protein n=1 Tax=Leersia perrieri TaxID=77586 RepID=A0A0D9WC00_9ORYZ
METKPCCPAWKLIEGPVPLSLSTRSRSPPRLRRLLRHIHRRPWRRRRDLGSRAVPRRHPSLRLRPLRRRRYCFARYDDADFAGLPDTGVSLVLLNTQNASDPESFERAQRKLMARVAGGLARETARFKEGVSIYGLGWCTRDIAAADCGLCVAQAVAEMPNYCRFRRGCRVLYSSCMARYETYPFFFPLDGGDVSDAGEYEMDVLNPRP